MTYRLPAPVFIFSPLFFPFLTLRAPPPPTPPQQQRCCLNSSTPSSYATCANSLSPAPYSSSYFFLLTQIFTEFLLTAPPPDRRSEAQRLFRFIASPLIRSILSVQAFINFILSDAVSSFLGVSYHASAAAAAAAAAAATGSIGAAFTLATGAALAHHTHASSTLSSVATHSFLLSSALCLPLSLIAYGCVLNAGRSFSSKTAGRFVFSSASSRTSAGALRTMRMLWLHEASPCYSYSPWVAAHAVPLQATAHSSCSCCSLWFSCVLSVITIAWRSTVRLVCGSGKAGRIRVDWVMRSECWLIAHLYLGAQVHHHHRRIRYCVLHRRHASQLRLQQDSVRPHASENCVQHIFCGFSQFVSVPSFFHHHRHAGSSKCSRRSQQVRSCPSRQHRKPFTHVQRVRQLCRCLLWESPSSCAHLPFCHSWHPAATPFVQQSHSSYIWSKFSALILKTEPLTFHVHVDTYIDRRRVQAASQAYERSWCCCCCGC